jgi:hypothetical protein
MSVKEGEQMKSEEILAKETRHFKKVSIGQSGELQVRITSQRLL